MSELNIYHHELRPDEYDEFYLKYEADKVFAELKESVKGLILDNYLKDKETRHNKYKRCLAMAEWCEERCARYDLLQEHSGFSWRREIDFYFRWSQRWLEIAEKFKDKETK